MRKSITQIVVTVLIIVISVLMLIVVFNITKQPTQDAKTSMAKYKEKESELEQISSRVALVFDNGNAELYNELKDDFEKLGIKYDEFDVGQSIDDDIVLLFAPEGDYNSRLWTNDNDNVVLLYLKEPLQVYATLYKNDIGETSSSFTANENYYVLHSKHYHLELVDSANNNQNVILLTNLLKGDINRNVKIYSLSQQTVYIDGEEHDFNTEGESYTTLVSKNAKSNKPFEVVFYPTEEDNFLVENPLRLSMVPIYFPITTTSTYKLCNLDEDELKILQGSNTFTIEAGECIDITLDTANNNLILASPTEKFVLYKDDFTLPSKNKLVLPSGDYKVNAFNDNTEPDVLQIYNDESFKSYNINANSNITVSISTASPTNVIARNSVLYAYINQKNSYIAETENNAKMEDFLNTLVKEGKTIVIVGPERVNIPLLEKYVDHYIFIPDVSAQLTGKQSADSVIVTGESLIPVWKKATALYVYGDAVAIPKLAIGNSIVIYVPYSIASKNLLYSIIAQLQ